MTKDLKELYRKYLENRLGANDFSNFREKVDNLSDDELWTLMNESEYDSQIVTPVPSGVEAELFTTFQATVKRQRRLRILRYAAALLILLVSCAGYYLFSDFNIHPNELAQIEVGNGDKAKVILPDGTRVNLNSNTVLAYDIKSGDHRRVIILKGEAYFDVTKDNHCPFTVSVGEMHIKVLGTAFNVKVLNDRVETSLFSGSVKLHVDNANTDYQLVPGQKSIFDIAHKTLRMTDNDPQWDAGWKDGYLVFKSESLSSVLSRIGVWYGVRIRLDATDMSNDLLTGSFHNETLQTVLTTLSLQYGFVCENNNDEIIIKHKH